MLQWSLWTFSSVNSLMEALGSLRSGKASFPGTGQQELAVLPFL